MPPAAIVTKAFLWYTIVDNEIKSIFQPQGKSGVSLIVEMDYALEVTQYIIDV